MADNTSRPEPDELDIDKRTEAAKRLFELEDEIKRLREEITREPEAEAESPESEPDLTEENPAEPKELTELDRAEIELLIRKARLSRTRANYSEAMDQLKAALVIDPNDASVMVELADLYAFKNRWKDALTLLSRANVLRPNDVAIERKHAEAVLKASLPVEALFGMAKSSEDQVANTKAAAMMSFIIPGSGQIVLGDYVKGGIILGAWLIAIVITLLIPNGILGLFALMEKDPKIHPSYVVLMPIAAALVICLYAVYDASSRTPRDDRSHKSRPKPPVDLPFE